MAAVAQSVRAPECGSDNAPDGIRTRDLRLRRTVPPTPGNASQRGWKELALAGASGQRPRHSRKCCHSDSRVISVLHVF